FGAAIATFGLIQEKIGAMTADCFALESAAYRLAGSMDAISEGVEGAGAQLSALNEYAVEYSFIKVFASEILDKAVDETLQIYGGYGFSADYPIEAIYRNSRINRIFEGTNEINRELTVDQLMKRAMRGQLDLLGPGQAAMMGGPLSALPPASPAGSSARQPEHGNGAEVVDGRMAAANLALENLKLATLQVAAMGAMAYMQALEGEQELVARVADMIGHVYLAESALLRAERLSGGSGAQVATDLATLYTYAAVDSARALALEALRRIPRGQEALPRLHAYLPEHGVDLIALRRRVAEAVYDHDGYPPG